MKTTRILYYIFFLDKVKSIAYYKVHETGNERALYCRFYALFLSLVDFLMNL